MNSVAVKLYNAFLINNDMIRLNRIVPLLRPLLQLQLPSLFRLQLVHKSEPFASSLKTLSALSNHTPQTSVPEIQTNSGKPITKETISCVNELIKSGKEGRLFAVVHICGKQFKITAGDCILIEGYWPPQNGDQIKLEKVLMVGGLEFTLIGRPVLPQDLVTIHATVIEKDLSHTKTVFFKRKRKQYQRINFFRSQTTMLRINEIAVKGKINEHKSVIQYERI